MPALLVAVKPQQPLWLSREDAVGGLSKTELTMSKYTWQPGNDTENNPGALG